MLSKFSVSTTQILLFVLFLQLIVEFNWCLIFTPSSKTILIQILNISLLKTKFLNSVSFMEAALSPGKKCIVFINNASIVPLMLYNNVKRDK